MQITIEIDDEDVIWLDRTSPLHGQSRDEAIREAVRKFRSARFDKALDAAFGLWKKHGFTEDGDAYQQRIRAEWDREWDVQQSTEAPHALEVLKAAE